MDATATIANPLVSVIVPARNEEISLGDCLDSLVNQSGLAFEIIVVDDHSTDRTREIAASFAGVRVIEADPLHASGAGKQWTGKNNAVATGARAAGGEWLLFTDADTVHLPESLARAVAEARENGADLLSYSPEQIAGTFPEEVILPVVFAELARQYSPAKVNDPSSTVAAANGQYILVRREAYDAVGGHASVAENILEDVALARLVKSSGRKVRFRYAADAVRTRMYRNWQQLRDGWTKNLALLFPHPIRLAALFLAWWTAAWAALLLGLMSFLAGDKETAVWLLLAVLLFLRSFLRIRRANFPLHMTAAAGCFGMPVFAYLLLRSKRAHANHTVIWKGRTYSGEDRADEDRSDQDGVIRKIAAPTTAGRSL